mgnify:FL=1|jgi:hypothetical protein
MSEGHYKIRRLVISFVIIIIFILILIITFLSLLPWQALGLLSISGMDKIYHVAAFSCLAFPLPLVRPRLIKWVLLGVIVFGGFIELIQQFFGREASLLDFIANGIGAIIGVTFARLIGFWAFGSDNFNIANNEPIKDD